MLLLCANNPPVYPRKMKRIISSFVLLALLALPGHALPAEGPAWGASSHAFGPARERRGKGGAGRISAEEAATIVRARTGGRVLSVRRMNSFGSDVYRVKVLIGRGEVRIYFVDAVTGEMR